MSNQIINVNEYDLAASADAYVAAITALAARTRTEGHPGVLSYNFYVNHQEATAGATIVYADAEAWVAHHQMAYQWEEMPTLQATVSLRRLTIFGPISGDMQQMLTNAGISITRYETHAAGFTR